MINLNFVDHAELSGANMSGTVDTEIEIHNDSFEIELKISGSYANGNISFKELLTELQAAFNRYINNI